MVIKLLLSFFIMIGTSFAIEFDADNDGVFDSTYKFNHHNMVDGSTLAEILDDDGADSGLDADLLDGQEGSYYQPKPVEGAFEDGDKTALDNTVHKTGDETIAGDKTFSDNVIIEGTLYSDESPTIVLFGDSIIDACETDTTTYNHTDSGTCFWHWANAILDQRFTVLNVAGVGGESFEDMVDRLQADVVAYSPKYCLVENANSFFNGDSAATTLAAIETIISTLEASAITPIFVSPMLSTSIDSAGESLIWNQVNHWLEQNATSSGFIYVDITPGYIDHADDYQQPLATHVADATHFNPNGAFAVGKVLAAALDFIPASTDYHFAHKSDAAVSNNPTMYGTGGTAGTNASGDIAATWRLEESSNCAIAGTKETRTDGHGYWQVATITPTSDNGGATISQHYLNYTGVGDVIYGVAEVEIGSVIPDAIYLEMIVTDASYAILDFVNTPQFNQTTYEISSWVAGDKMLFKTQTITVQATTARISLRVYVSSDVGQDAIIKVGSAGVVKVQ